MTQPFVTEFHLCFISEATALALADAAKGLRMLPEKMSKSRFGEFEKMFGRGQQYLSFIKKSV